MKKPTPILGSFGKGVDGSIALNFGAAGGARCDTGCRHHPDSTSANATNACYAVRFQQVYTSVGAMLTDRESLPVARICGQAIVEVRAAIAAGRSIPWFRFSVAGSIEDADKLSPLDISQLRTLCILLRDNGIPVHFPIETTETGQRKAPGLRAIVGDIVTIRESMHDVQSFLRATDAVSVVVGIKGMTCADKVSAATSVAKARTAFTGRKTVVCPAITHSWAKRYKGIAENPRAKCGGCTACADALVDIVYPLH